MKKSVVLTLLGPDRPGLVEALAALVAEHGGNWLESRMAHMAGEFAGILRVDVPLEQAAHLESALAGLRDQGLQIVVKPAEAETPSGGSYLALDLLGQDRPGIVREISQALAARNVNVEQLETETLSAPMSGETLFQARALLRLPRDGSRQELQESLEAIAHDLMVDIQLEDASTTK